MRASTKKSEKCQEKDLKSFSPCFSKGLKSEKIISIFLNNDCILTKNSCILLKESAGYKSTLPGKLYQSFFFCCKSAEETSGRESKCASGTRHAYKSTFLYGFVTQRSGKQIFCLAGAARVQPGDSPGTGRGGQTPSILQPGPQPVSRQAGRKGQGENRCCSRAHCQGGQACACLASVQANTLSLPRRNGTGVGKAAYRSFSLCGLCTFLQPPAYPGPGESVSWNSSS